MSTSINIPARAFAAALKCASKSDVRYYLNGVYLDFPKGRIVATTGHFMFVGQIERADVPAVIVPRELVESALRSLTKKGRETFDIAVEIDTRAATAITLTSGGNSFTGQAIDGRFPEYERVVPLEVSGEIAQFDADLVATCADALRTYTAQYTHIAWEIQHNGDDGSLMTGQGCLCVVMPCRTGGTADTDWYFQPVKLQAVA